MSRDLLIHGRTKLQIDHFLQDPGHGLLLTGRSGTGKKTLALFVAAKALGLESEQQLEHYPYIKIVDPADRYITIDDIRDLKHFLKLKTPNPSSQLSRIITIIDAERMTLEAQNAFLKSLEEPPADTLIILTTQSEKKLLPTIISRVGQVSVLPVSFSQTAEYFDTVSPTDIKKFFQITQGLPGALTSLVDNDSKSLLENIDNAKILLNLPANERLLRVDMLAKDKDASLELIEVLKTITRGALRSSSDKGNNSAVLRWQRSLNTVLDAQDNLNKNANIKLVLDELLLNI